MFARNRDQTVEWLRELTLFDGCTRHQLQAAARLFCAVDVEPGQVLSQEGGWADQFIVIIDGSARATTAAGDSTRLGCGAYIGEGALAHCARSPVTVVVESPMTVLVATPGELRDLLELVPPVAHRLSPTHPAAVTARTPAARVGAGEQRDDDRSVERVLRSRYRRLGRAFILPSSWR
jgi:CRP-like cAMP-binding protein